MTQDEMIRVIVSGCLRQHLSVTEWLAKQKDPNTLYRENLGSFTPNEWTEIIEAAKDRLKPSLKTQRRNAIREIEEITKRIKNDIDRLEVLNQFLRDTNASYDPAEHQRP